MLGRSDLIEGLLSKNKYTSSEIYSSLCQSVINPDHSHFTSQLIRTVRKDDDKYYFANKSDAWLLKQACFNNHYTLVASLLDYIEGEYLHENHEAILRETCARNNDKIVQLLLSIPKSIDKVNHGLLVSKSKVFDINTNDGEILRKSTQDRKAYLITQSILEYAKRHKILIKDFDQVFINCCRHSDLDAVEQCYKMHESKNSDNLLSQEAFVQGFAVSCVNKGSNVIDFFFGRTPLTIEELVKLADIPMDQEHLEFYHCELYSYEKETLEEFRSLLPPLNN